MGTQKGKENLPKDKITVSLHCQNHQQEETNLVPTRKKWLRRVDFNMLIVSLEFKKIPREWKYFIFVLFIVFY